LNQVIADLLWYWNRRFVQDRDPPLNPAGLGI
jgi:hypothetical protein